MFPLAIGEALGTPVLVAAVRRYSDTRQRSISFSMFYVMMNVGFLVAAYLFDFVRQGLGEHALVTLPVVGQLSTYRMLFLVGVAIQIVIFPLSISSAPARKPQTRAKDRSRSLEARRQEPLDFFCLYGARQCARYRAVVSGLLQQSGFYRLLAFLILISFIKLIYKQMDYVYPQFGIRELGPGAPIGRLWASIITS